MEDLQATLQSVLSDPARMAQIAALAESLGLKPPEKEAAGAGQQTTDQPVGAAIGRPPEAAAASSMPIPDLEGLDLGKLMAGLSAMQGREDRVLGALRPTLGPSGQARTDRALRAAKLARLAGQLLRRGREGHV